MFIGGSRAEFGAQQSHARLRRKVQRNWLRIYVRRGVDMNWTVGFDIWTYLIRRRVSNFEIARVLLLQAEVNPVDPNRNRDVKIVRACINL